MPKYKKHDFYSIIEPNDKQGKHPFALNFSHDGADNVKCFLISPENESIGFTISKQQLAELGALFLALAGTQYIDFDSCVELLDGFNLDGEQPSLALSTALVRANTKSKE